MTVATETSRASYTGNGTTTAFSFPYYFLADVDLVVIRKKISDGTELPLVLNTDYTVAGAGVAAGGTVTTIGALSPISSAYKLTIYRDPAKTQGLDLVENDKLPAEPTEKALDRLTMIAQRLSNWISRTMKLSEGMPDGAFDPTLPVDVNLYPNTVPLLNSSGNGFESASEWPTAQDIEDAEANAAAALASAAAALASQTAAASSATAAAASATAASASATAAAVSAAAALTSENNAEQSEDNAADSETNAAASASAASTSAGAAATSATAAAGSASAASTSAGAASTSATAAAASQTAAAASATAAAVSAAAAAAAGGGGGSLHWIEDAESPQPVVENSIFVYKFTPTLQQKVYTVIKVPNGYPGGTPIKLKTVWYSPDSSGNWGFNTLATLIRPATDLITTSTNTKSSTQSGALSGGIQNKPQAVSFDLADSSGKINGVSVAAGDVIKVCLSETGGTGASELAVPVYGAEVTFS